MAFSISNRRSGDVDIMVLSGRLVLGDGTGSLRTAAHKLLENKANILIDLSDVDYIDSSGLGELVSAFASATSRGCQLKLLRPMKRVDSLLHVTKMYSTFEIFEDEAIAVASFQKPSA